MHINGFVPEKDDKKTMLDFGKFAPKQVAAASSGEFIIPEVTPISQQGDWPSCTTNATMDTAETLIGLQSPEKVVQLSRSAAWYFSRKREGVHKKIQGVPLATAFRVAEEIGACTEDLWPYDVPSTARDAKTKLPLSQKQWFLKQPSLEARKSMHANKLGGWVRIFELQAALLDAVDYAIFSSHPVVYGTAIGDEFRLASGSDVLFPPEPAGIIGRHAVVIVGRRVKNGRRQYLIRNSWGKYWAARGYVWVDQTYVTWGDAMNHTVGTRATEILH